MVLEVIYVVRHGFRSNFVLDPLTKNYINHIPNPTGIPTDPALTSHGVAQAAELAVKVATDLDPRVDYIYSSPFYRCVQTIVPAARKLGMRIRVERGFSEFFSLAPFPHPSPAPVSTLSTLFPSLIDPTYTSLLTPHANGETIAGLHTRIAVALARFISALDADPAGPRAALICTHAAAMIAMGRVLTGKMPESMEEEDFGCFTASLSAFRRSGGGAKGWANVEGRAGKRVGEGDWTDVPEWEGKGVMGGWDCLMNADTGFLSNGPERGWHFSGDESYVSFEDEPVVESEGEKGPKL